MVKKYIEGETKQQRKARKAFEKAQKSVETVEVLPQENVAKKYNILCLKHGQKYSHDYVNILYNMAKRHCTLEFDFWCMTDDPNDLDPNIKVIRLPSYLQGWWCKPYMFSDEIPIEGTILYMDLDVVLASNIDKLFTWQPGHWCTIRDFTRSMRPNWKKYNSSVVRFEKGQLSDLWEDYSKRRVAIQRQFFGDQDYLYDFTYKTKGAMLYPESWIQSWKWEIRSSKEFKPGGSKGSRIFKKIETVTPRVECCVCVFHGDPNPHRCQDPWVIENWR